MNLQSQIVHQFTEDVTIPKLVVFTFFLLLGICIRYLLTQARNDVMKHMKSIKKQHRKHNHGTAFEICEIGNCSMYDPMTAHRLQHLRRA